MVQMPIGANASQADDDVDMDALRKKYSRPREELLAEAQQKQQQGLMPTDKVMGAVNDRLSDIVMCQNCQAHGTVKKQYGFRVMDEQCEVCGGEGVIRKGLQKYASAELKAKVKQVEALVAACEDLDELERLEAALNKKTIAALDAVLDPGADAPVPAAEEEEAGQVV